MYYINELRDGDRIIEHYFCQSKQSLKSKAGKTYISMKLQDKTGTIDAKIWDMNKDIQSFEEKTFIKVEAHVTTFNNALQFNIKRLRKSNEGEYDPSEYIATSKYDLENMHKELMDFIKSIQTPCIKEMLTMIFVEDPIFSTKIKTHSAAKTMHHNYLGGLLEHTVAVTKLCDTFSQLYPYANRDILICGGMLHDVTKIIELSDMPENDYTDEGQMLGHIYMGAELVHKTASKIDGFPAQLENLIKHTLLAHHGELEYGSPKLPLTIEAHLLACADNLDAKAKMYEDMIDKNDTSGNWLGYSKCLLRNVRNSKYS